MRQLVSSGSSTVVWHSYVTLSCTGWTFLYVSSISLEWPSSGVFKAGRPSTWWTAAHLLRMSPAVSVFALPAHLSTTSSQQVRSSSVFCVFCCRPDDVELSAWQSLWLNAYSDEKFWAALKTLFSKCQNTDVAQYSALSMHYYLLTYLVSNQ